jgi:hypothetical protein
MGSKEQFRSYSILLLQESGVLFRVLPHFIIMDYNFKAIEYIPILVFSAGFLRWIRSRHLGLDWLHTGLL